MRLYVLQLFLLVILLPFANSQDSLQFRVEGVCGMCQFRIEKIANQTKGVQSSFWNEETKMLDIVYDPTTFNENKLYKRIASVGHDTEKRKAPKAAYEALPKCCLYKDPNNVHVKAHPEEQNEAQSSNNELMFRVEGVCGMCQNRIENAAQQIKGVQTAIWNKATKLLSVAYDPVRFDEEKLHQRIASVGHDTEQAKATQVAYESLPACCLYKAPNNIHHQAAQEGATTEAIMQGMIYERNGQGEEVPLIGATVQWLGQTEGVATDVDGHFSLMSNGESEKLVISYVGYQPDTIFVGTERMLAVVLTNNAMLDAVEVNYRRKSTEVSFLNPVKTQLIDEKELLKAACCSLSESFETNPAVDVTFTDAVTGTRKIQLLGLAGPYVQTTREAIPDIRGLSALYGFTYTPGTWIEGIHLNLGTGSVVNGFEGITGQINVELRKPENTDRLYLNLYANQMGRLEGNAHFGKKLNEQVSTALLLHGKRQQAQNDRNDDGFLDMPRSNHFIGLNRWKFQLKNGWQLRAGIKFAWLDNTSGQLNFDEDSDTQNLWGANVKTNRVDGWVKIGKVFPSKPYSSIGLQLAGSYHDQAAFFNDRVYDAEQENFYANLIYQNIIRTTQHNYKVGASFQWDRFDETAAQFQFDRNETVPGVFGEYTYKYLDQFTAVVGLRGDYHNNYGFFAIPRLHLRFAPRPATVIRASLGRGWRTANIFAENVGLFASNRAIQLFNTDNGNPYGLNAEIAWNAGLNFTQEFSLGGERTALLSLDAYRTWFENQIVVDYETAQQISFYNLDGQSFSNSLQAQLDVELLPRLDLRLAYRFNDVQTDYQSGQLQQPLTARHLAFGNIGYTTKDDWAFDFTLSWQGQKRIPSTAANPVDFQLDDFSPHFFIANTQITKSFENGLSIYAGAENLFNFRQSAPILSADDPSRSFFDSALVWGPIFGRNIYTGVRFRM